MYVFISKLDCGYRLLSSTQRETQSDIWWYISNVNPNAARRIKEHVSIWLETVTAFCSYHWAYKILEAMVGV